MPYTPELDKNAVCSLRRLAWSIKKPMSKTLEEALLIRSDIANRSKVCAACKDQSKCAICYFNGQQLKKKLQGIQAPKPKSGGKRPAR
jgi:hypothetical protein